MTFYFNGWFYFLLGDNTMGFLFKTHDDLCSVENSYGIIENGVVWRNGEIVKNHHKNRTEEPEGKTVFNDSDPIVFVPEGNHTKEEKRFKEKMGFYTKDPNALKQFLDEEPPRITDHFKK